MALRQPAIPEKRHVQADGIHHAVGAQEEGRTEQRMGERRLYVWAPKGVLPGAKVRAGPLHVPQQPLWHRVCMGRWGWRQAAEALVAAARERTQCLQSVDGGGAGARQHRGSLPALDHKVLSALFTRVELPHQSEHGEAWSRGHACTKADLPGGVWNSFGRYHVSWLRLRVLGAYAASAAAVLQQCRRSSAGIRRGAGRVVNGVDVPASPQFHLHGCVVG